MKNSQNNFLFFLVISLLLFTSGCVSTGTSVLKLNYETLENTKAISPSSVNIKLIKFQDSRDGINEPEYIGSRQAAYFVAPITEQNSPRFRPANAVQLCD